MTNSSRSGFVNIIGPPNSGKSTLINNLIGKKISIVSSKPQTTRFCVRGILNFKFNDKKEKSQIIFVDTPGIFEPKRNLDKVILQNALKQLNSVDYTILVFDCYKKNGLDEFLQVMKIISYEKNKISLVLNKIDLIDKTKLLKLAKTLSTNIFFENIFMISAIKGEGCEDLVRFLASKVPKSNFLFDEDYLTNIPNQLFSSEVTREKLFKLLNHELPYNLAVQTVKWLENKNDIKIYQDIYVAKTNHKIIVLGKNGENIKKTGTMARLELKKIFNKKIHLFLFVKVKKNWIDNPINEKLMGINQNA